MEGIPGQRDTEKPCLNLLRPLQNQPTKQKKPKKTAKQNDKSSAHHYLSCTHYMEQRLLIVHAISSPVDWSLPGWVNQDSK